MLLKRGLGRMKENKKLLAVLLVLILVECLIFCVLVYQKNKASGLDALTYTLKMLVEPIAAAGSDVAYIVLLGRPFLLDRYSKQLLQARMFNGVVEPPQVIQDNLITSGEFKGCEELVFESPGISIKNWEDNQGQISSALNRNVLRISQGESANQFCVIVADKGTLLPTHIDWDDQYITSDDSEYVVGIALPYRVIAYDCDKEPMVAICGTTGSGKSNLVRTQVYQAVKKGVKVYLIDLKRGVDYGTYYKEHCTVLFNLEEINSALKNVVQEMLTRYDLFRSIDNVTNIVDYRRSGREMQRILVVVDELAQITETRGVPKATRDVLEQINDSIIKISQLGRASGITLLVAGQRLDQNTFPGQLRSNINVRICGKADENLSIVVYGDGRADELVPKNIRGRFMLEDGTLFQAFYLNK